jgi:hypothetical protein
MYIQYDVEARTMMLNTTFNNISVIAWRSVLLVEGTGIPGKKHQSTARYIRNLFSFSGLYLSESAWVQVFIGLFSSLKKTSLHLLIKVTSFVIII